MNFTKYAAQDVKLHKNKIYEEIDAALEKGIFDIYNSDSLKKFIEDLIDKYRQPKLMELYYYILTKINTRLLKRAANKLNNRLGYISAPLLNVNSIMQKWFGSAGSIKAITSRIVEKMKENPIKKAASLQRFTKAASLYSSKVEDNVTDESTVKTLMLMKNAKYMLSKFNNLEEFLKLSGKDIKYKEIVETIKNLPDNNFINTKKKASINDFHEFIEILEKIIHD